MRTYDIVLFGATGFTGRLVAEYLGRTARDLRWAIAGRNREKLEAVRRHLREQDTTASDVPIEVVDVDREEDLSALVPQARVVCTTVGPYAKHGARLVAACAAHGTHYCDITGEPQFVRASIDQNHELAIDREARIVHCCGFDSIPSDLGVHALHERAAKNGDRLAWAKASFRARGALSGGTIASMVGVMEAVRSDRSLARLLANPRALEPDPSVRGARERLVLGFDREFDGWAAPFLMAAVNTKVVRRSNALLGRDGDDFRYSEMMTFRRGPRGLVAAAGTTAGLAVLGAVLSLPPLRSLASRRLIPRPGEGPSREAMERGFYEVRFLAETRGGARLEARFGEKTDPGYTGTAKLLGETARCLAEDEASLPRRFGVLTPASALGMTLVDRLRSAGITIEIDT